MIRFLILVGYFEITMYLQLTGKLNQYINTHYAYLAYISSFISFVLAIVQLIIWMKNIKVHSHLNGRLAKISSPIILAIPVIISISFPTVTLNSETVSAKGYHFPLAQGSSSTAAKQDGITIQYLKPDTSLYFTSSSYQKEMKSELKAYQNSDKLNITAENYMEVMELIYLYPDEFTHKTITYTGFIYNETEKTNYQFLFRFGIIHCIADSGVYGLLTTGQNISYKDNTWVTMTGKIELEYHQTLKQTLPVLHISSSHSVKEPSNPYVYRVF
ncbi:MAG: TIGR03943 family protein [Streptococcus sp.]|nr:TIGR03943 family protein [Streptococcus sp.]